MKARSKQCDLLFPQHHIPDDCKLRITQGPSDGSVNGERHKIVADGSTVQSRCFVVLFAEAYLYYSLVTFVTWCRS